MRKRWKRAGTLIFCVLFGLLACPHALAAGSSGVSRDYAVTSLTNSEVRARTFTVHASYTYYGVSRRSSYTEGGNFYDCRSCDGTGWKDCTRCQGTGMIEKPVAVLCQYPSAPLCQSSCDGMDYMCDECGHLQRSPRGRREYCAHSWAWYPYTTCTCETTKTEPGLDECLTCRGMGGRECTRCDGNGWYETAGHTVTTYPSDPLPQEVLVEFLLDGRVVSSGTVSLSVYQENHVSNELWEKWANVDAEATITADVGMHTVEARINNDRRSWEYDWSNNSRKIEVEVRPVIDLDGDFVAPGANYRVGTEVISTFKIQNRDPENNGMDVTPEEQLRADFRAVNPISGAAVASMTASQIVIPQGSSNFVWFKWRVPENYAADTVRLELKVNPDQSVDEIDYMNNTVQVTNGVVKPRISGTPDIVFEEKKPAGWREPSGREPLPTGGILTSGERRDNASWQVWEWDAAGEDFQLKTYGAKISPVLAVEPDSRSLSRKWLGRDRVWQMRAGYGFTADLQVGAATLGETPKPSMITDAQSANAYFPEFGYSGSVENYATLERMSSDGFELRLNPNSIDSSGRPDPRRLHYVPLWYPDGPYRVRALAYDLWTPAGMLIGETASELLILGSVYDDYYTAH